MKDESMTFQQRSLFQQGYQKYSPQELTQLEWGLRFTPAACSLLAAYGLFTQQPYILFAVAILGIWAFLAPSAHPMDLIYNHAIAPIFKAAKLPENPFQRRLACLSAGVMNFAAAILFIFEMPIPALVVGVTLLILQAIVITTHFCTLSWMYEGGMRMLGKWHLPIDENTAKALLEKGAQLIDVRSQAEFSKGSVSGAINLPLEELQSQIEAIGEKVCLLFCASGTRSHIATEKLREAGLKNIHNLGEMSRAANLL